MKNEQKTHETHPHRISPQRNYKFRDGQRRVYTKYYYKFILLLAFLKELTEF